MSTAAIEKNNLIARATTGKTMLVAGLAWFAGILVTAIAGGFHAEVGQKPVAILVAVVLPPVVFAVLYKVIDSFREWVNSLDMRLLIMLHSWRMVGMGFVFLYFHDKLPALFAFPAGIGDAMAAIGALFIGIALYENATQVPKKRIYYWNTFGLLDFIVAVTMGVTTRVGEVFYINGQAGSEIMGIFPLALIPGFAVPFFIITHLVIYIQLRQDKHHNSAYT